MKVLIMNGNLVLRSSLNLEGLWRLMELGDKGVGTVGEECTWNLHRDHDIIV